ncbi:unnamed protein product [Parascedosporium putredinis]|uniref:F-box domain-containing protein n=1 Tax=Parascedosporium putredinis TaxID=1442378 RepID=A0A9P1H2P6_9PEZI|nr:unnamed protein product [Parascedosporium putredinis]CAI7995163.1 unnamed protein product [Parascedosporium putredinis]
MDGAGPIENLPNEVLSIILSQLGTHDLLDILRVSRRFNSCTASVLYRHHGDPAAALAGDGDGSSGGSDAPRGDPRKWHSWFRPRLLDLDPSPPATSTADVPFTEVILPEGEDDIYLLARTIVKRDPPKGLCPSHITIHEGHIRVSREWLAKASEPEKSGGDSGTPRFSGQDRERTLGYASASRRPRPQRCLC